MEVRVGRIGDALGHRGEGVGRFPTEQAHDEILPFTHQHQAAIDDGRGHDDALAFQVTDQGDEAAGRFDIGLELQLYRIADAQLDLVQRQHPGFALGRGRLDFAGFGG